MIGLDARLLRVDFGLAAAGSPGKGVAAIRRGEAENIAGEFPPGPVAPLAAEVNQLIDANREDRRRASLHPPRR